MLADGRSRSCATRDRIVAIAGVLHREPWGLDVVDYPSITSLVATRYPLGIMRALSIRQPYVEEILRGIKKIEYRSRATRKIDERFYIYASQKPAEGQERRFRKLGCKFEDLPSGVIFSDSAIQYATQEMAGTYGHHASGILYNGQRRTVLSTRNDGTLTWNL